MFTSVVTIVFELFTILSTTSQPKSPTLGELITPNNHQLFIVHWDFHGIGYKF
jgi:hypothetical protein